MPVHLPLFPLDFANNQCYRYIQDEHNTHGTDAWSKNYLVENFGLPAVQAIIDEEFLQKVSGGRVKLSFAIEGTPAADIVKHTSRRLRLFRELLNMLPQKCHYNKHKLKQCLVFLTGFRKVQVFPLPGSALTCIAADIPELEDDLNRSYMISEGLPEPFKVEQRFLYRIDRDEGLDQMNNDDAGE